MNDVKLNPVPPDFTSVKYLSSFSAQTSISIEFRSCRILNLSERLVRKFFGRTIQMISLGIGQHWWFFLSHLSSDNLPEFQSGVIRAVQHNPDHPGFFQCLLYSSSYTSESRLKNSSGKIYTLKSEAFTGPLRIHTALARYCSSCESCSLFWFIEYRFSFDGTDNFQFYYEG